MLLRMLPLLIALPALADLRPLEGKCLTGDRACFDEIARTTAACEPVLRKHSSSPRGEVAVDWRRCPVSGFRTTHDVDYVIVWDPQGGVWAFTNFVDPTLAAVRDFRIVSKKLFVLETSSTRDVARRYCLLDLSAEKPDCLIPMIPEIEDQAKALLKPEETFAGDDWKLVDAGPKKASFTRPIFHKGDAKRVVGNINAVLNVDGIALRISRVIRTR